MLYETLTLIISAARRCIWLGFTSLRDSMQALRAFDRQWRLLILSSSTDGLDC